MKRSEAREKVMQMIYLMEINGSFTKEDADDFIESSIAGNDNRRYASETFENLINRLDEIDDIISCNSSGWGIERMPKTDLAIARLAVCEMMYADDIPDIVTINEAVELANRYGTEKSGSFINGVLGSVLKNK